MTHRDLKAALEAARIKAGMSKLEVARRTGIPYPTITKRFREPETTPFSELIRIARVIGMPMEIGGKYDA